MKDDPAHVQLAIDALERLRGSVDVAVLDAALAPLRQRQAAFAEAAAPAGLKTRNLTVLFADVVGSTALVERLDAEDAMQVLNASVQRLADIVRAHQGTVLRFTGDGVKAAFGVSETREDDAERAVRAGLAMLQRQHGLPDLPLPLRVGVHTGSVTLGAGAEADHTAMGAAVHIAARMEQSAPPDSLRISHETWTHVRGLFVAEPQPLLGVKGVDAPMQTYLVRGAIAGAAAPERGVQGAPTPLVGRHAELQALTEAVARAAETRQAQSLLMVGDAGLGKSRLLRECLAGLTGPAGVRVLAARLRPDSALRPWSVLHALVAGLCGVRDADSADLAHTRVEDGLARWFDDDGVAQAHRVGHLAGLDFGDSPHLRGLDPRALRDQALPAWRRLLRGLAERGGALPVVVVEDLHWADASSLELLHDMQLHAAELPLALLMTARPALIDRLPGGWPAQNLLRLQPLPAGQRAELGRVLLRRIEALPQALLDQLVGQADGNPYYMEELVRRLLDDGVIVAEGNGEGWALRADRLGTLKLPTTLVNLLQARLDALPVAARQAAQAASIVGHVFWDQAMAALDAAAVQVLPTLQRSATVHAQASSAFDGTLEFHFDHHLLHQVTYDTVLKAERRNGHRAAAHWLAARTQGREAEFGSLTGEHAERGGDLALAITCFERAAEDAARRHANADALAHLQRALSLLADSDPVRRLGLLERQTALADTIGDRGLQAQAVQARLALLQAHVDLPRHADALLAQALLADRCSDSNAAERQGRQAVALAERCGAGKVAAEAHGLLCWLAKVRGDLDAARSHADAGLRWAASVRAAHPDTEVKLLLLSAVVALELNRLDDASTVVLDALARSQQQGATRAQLGALDLLGDLAVMLGRWDEALARADQMHDLAVRVGNRPRVAHALFRRGQVALARAEFAALRALCTQVVAIARDNGDRRIEAHALLLLGQAQRGLGDDAAARDWHRQAQDIFETLGEPGNACHAAAEGALDTARLGDTQLAVEAAAAVLLRLAVADSAPTDAVLEARWACQRVFAAAGDARAGPLLQQLAAEVQRRVRELTPDAPDDRQRLVDAVPLFREVVAAGIAAGFH
jgi:class 3 adenylate cyclase/tetratricopeptide (TPR) repeat protein